MLSHQDRKFTLIPGRNHTDEYARILLDRLDSFTQTSLSPVAPDHLPANPFPRPGSSRCIALAPGGAKNLLRDNPLRRWPLESYVALAGALLQRDWQVVLTGGPADRWVSEAFAELPVANVIGQTNIPELLALYVDCDAVVSHDTGPLHLAGLTPCRLIGLFGPTSPWMFMPRRRGAVALWGGEGLACRPCYDGRDYPACSFNGCMQSISPGRVIETLDRLLSEDETRRAGCLGVELIHGNTP
jgi:heptosyltransferase II